MDAWSPLQMAKMRVGGNTELKNFFREQEFPSNLSVKGKFDNDAMEKYRERLIAVAQGKSADKIEKIGYIPRQPRIPKQQLSSPVNAPGGFSRGSSRGIRRPLSSMSGGLDSRKPAAKVWDLDSWMTNIQKKSSEVASTVAKGTADVTSKLQKGMEEVGQQLKEKEFGSQISSGWSAAVGWASKTVENISVIIRKDDRIKLYNKNANSASSKSKNMESKSSKEYFLGQQRGISSNSYFDNVGDPPSHKAKVAKTLVATDDSERSGFQNKGGSFTQHPETKFASQIPIEQKVAAEKNNSKNKAAGFKLNSLDDTLSGVNDLTHEKQDNVSVSSGDDETWEW